MNGIQTVFVELARKAETRAIISQLSIHEMRCVLHRKEFARTIPPGTAELAYRRFYDHVEGAVLKVVPYGRDVALEFDRVVRVCFRTSRSCQSARLMACFAQRRS